MPKAKAVMIFLTIFAVALGIFILSWGFDSYTSNKNITATTAKPSSDCGRYMFRVSNPSYDGYAVSFELKNEDYALEDINNVTADGITRKSTEAKNLIPGLTRSIKINDIKIDKNFSVYVDSCEVYRKTCSLEENTCT